MVQKKCIYFLTYYSKRIPFYWTLSNYLNSYLETFLIGWAWAGRLVRLVPRGGLMGSFSSDFDLSSDFALSSIPDCSIFFGVIQWKRSISNSVNVYNAIKFQVCIFYIDSWQLSLLIHYWYLIRNLATLGEIETLIAFVSIYFHFVEWWCQFRHSVLSPVLTLFNITPTQTMGLSAHC